MLFHEYKLADNEAMYKISKVEKKGMGGGRTAGRLEKVRFS